MSASRGADVDVYRHLRRRLCIWSVRVDGRVVDHVPAIALRDVALIVRPGALARVRRRQIREVCAHARGIAVDAPRPESARRLRFDPYGAGAFAVNGEPATASRLAWFEADGTAWISED
jgi:hypothetical protein